MAVDESVDASRCGGHEKCQVGKRCLTHNLWMELSDQLFNFLNRITLAEVVARSSVREVAMRQDAVNARGIESSSSAVA